MSSCAEKLKVTSNVTHDVFVSANKTKSCPSHNASILPLRFPLCSCNNHGFFCLLPFHHLLAVCVCLAFACCVAPTAAAPSMPAACLRAATTLCQGSHTSALRCLMTKVRAADTTVPQECTKALEQLPARHKKQGAGGSRVQSMTRMLTEAGPACAYTTNPVCTATCTVSGPNQCTNNCLCSSYVAAADCSVSTGTILYQLRKQSPCTTLL